MNGRLLCVVPVLLLLLSCASVCRSEGVRRRRRLKESNKKKSLNILTLGGSTTWGARLPKRTQAYPNVLGQLGGHTVVNKAIRATDAQYPSLCIRSMLEEKDEENLEYDVILFEYSINGPSGIDTLVKRLQYRYPDAMLIYVHLYSLQTAVVDKDGNQALTYKREDRRDVQWRWRPVTKATRVREPIRRFFEEIGGYVYEFPRPKVTPYDVLPLFADDWHHLSGRGHDKVARDLDALIQRAENRPPPKNRPTDLYDTKWGYGDDCKNWFESGETDVKTTGATMKPLDSGEAYINNKYALEFPHVPPAQVSASSSTKKPKINGGTIEIINQQNIKVPLYITYMSAHQIYPITKITVNNETVTMVNPDRDRFHVAKTTQVGFAVPGVNVVRIEPTFSSFAPFRLVGAVLFGFKYHGGLPFRKAHNGIPTDVKLEDAPGDEDTEERRAENERALNVLVLGGPQTWGEGLNGAESPYPERIGAVTLHRVDNHGVRATDAFYVSVCAQSMLESDEDEDDNNKKAKIEYDVILLEYSFANPFKHMHVNEGDVRGFRTLVKRLQYRYPNAVMVYVHLWSLRDSLVSDITKRTPNEPPRMRRPMLEQHVARWSFKYTHAAIHRVPPAVKSVVKSVGGHIIGLPIPDTPDKAMSYFSKPTWDSLSSTGHRVIGDMIAKLLAERFDGDDGTTQNGLSPAAGFEALEGSWGWGDRCTSWHTMGGIVPFEHAGVRVVEDLDGDGRRWALTYSGTGGTLTVTNTKNIDVPLFLTWSVIGDGDGTTGGRVILHKEATDLSPEVEDGDEVGDGDGRRSPLVMGGGDAFRTTRIGIALPGRNVITFRPSPGKKLKIIGVALYGFQKHEDVLPLKTIDGPES